MFKLLENVLSFTGTAFSNENGNRPDFFNSDLSKNIISLQLENHLFYLQLSTI